MSTARNGGKKLRPVFASIIMFTEKAVVLAPDTLSDAVQRSTKDPNVTIPLSIVTLQPLGIQLERPMLLDHIKGADLGADQRTRLRGAHVIAWIPTWKVTELNLVTMEPDR